MFISHAVAAAKSLQSCPTLCDPIDGNPPGSPVPGILQARTLEWAAISFSNAWKWKVKVKLLSHVRLLATPWTSKVILTTLQASLQQYMNWELPDVQPGFRKGRGTRDQIANIVWIIEKAREKKKKRDFPGGPVAKAPCSQRRGPGVRPPVREVDPTCCN